MHYVACLDLTGRRCLVVGRSESKVRALEACGAEVVSVDRYEPAPRDVSEEVVARMQGK